jgi:YVTN family beta-propeller protein
MNAKSLPLAVVCAALLSTFGQAQTGFVNWESPHVHPLELGPEGTLLAVNTPDGRLEVLDRTRAGLSLRASIPVGVDPVSVRHRAGDEVWVVNHVSDTVSVVDLATGNVVATLDTDDEPCDVVFTHGKAYVSCSQANTVLVFDPTDLSAAPGRIPIDGEDPRAMAIGPRGEVLVAIFESGNGSTILGGGLDLSAVNVLLFPPNVVTDPAGPWGGQNPPPNSGAAFVPPIGPGLSPPPAVALIVRKDAAGKWWDDNGGDWTDLVSGSQANLSGRPMGWDLPDYDLALIDPVTDRARYARQLMTMCMSLAVNPVTGVVTLVGTEATNEVRFEPNLTGTFSRVKLARLDLSLQTDPPPVVAIDDLNPHLDYSTGTVLQGERDKSLGDPRAIVWSADGMRGYVAGMGSNNVVVLDAGGQRTGSGAPIDVGEGPTGLALDEASSRLYVLNKFDGSISIVDTRSETELGRVGFYDPEPSAIKSGRKHLYDTHATSGLGQTACASCHVDARFDRLAWDLGDPGGAKKGVGGQNKGANIPGLNTGFKPHHPMKGPMTTQTLQDIIGKEPHHWRGDRDGLEEFNGAFIGLLGDDTSLSPVEMQEFEDFLATIHFPPNPYRNLDNSLPSNLPLPGHYSTGRFTPAGTPLPDGDAQNGLALYRPPSLLDGGLACVTCHTLPTGMGTDMELQGGVNLQPLAPGPNGEAHHMLVSVDGSNHKAIKVPQLRNLYDKVGFDATQRTNRAGFGMLHDGSVDSLARFVEEPAFSITSEQDTADLVAFMLSFSGSDLPVGKTNINLLEPPGTTSQDTHAAVGRQVTIADPAPSAASQALIANLTLMAKAGEIGLIVKGRVAGEARGFYYDGVAAAFQSDRAIEQWTEAQVLAGSAPGSELTYTVVPTGTEVRCGVDRDADGFFDGDEIDAGSDPADPNSTPGSAPSPANVGAPPSRTTPTRAAFVGPRLKSGRGH